VKNSIHRRWLCASLLALAHPALPADPLPPIIVVSASRTEQASIETPASITIIDHDEIQRSAARNLLQLLQARAGIQLDSLFGDGSNSTIDMRGFGPTAGSNTLVLVDGRRLNNSSDSAAPDLNSIDLQQVERIEIVQGSAGVLYGNQAVGGLINIITRTPDKAEGSVTLGAGSYHGHALRAAFSNRLKSGLGYSISASRRDSDNYRDNNDSERKDFNLRLDYKHDNGQVFIEQQLVDDRLQLPGALLPEEMQNDRRASADAYRGDYSNNRSRVTRLSVKQALTTDWSFEGEASFRKNKRDFQSSGRTYAGSHTSQDRTVKGLNPRLIGNFSLPSGEATLTAGADLERTDYALVSSFAPQLLEQSINALYLQANLPVAPLISTTLGWRKARIDNRIDSGSGTDRLDDTLNARSIGLDFKPDADLRLFLRFDENYRFATVEEHTNVVYGQPVGIKNQTGLSQEAGIEWQTGPLNAKAVIYRLDLENEIAYDASQYANINLDKTRRKGVMLESNWQVTEQIRLGASFTYTDPVVTAGPYDGKRIPLVSSRQARFDIDWSPAPQWQLFGEWTLRSDRVFGSDFTNEFEHLPGYGLLDAGAHYRTGPWHYSLRVDNLLGKAYAGSGSIGYPALMGYYPAPERSAWLSAEYRFD
jgi:iron complex outermembrane recepter protein